MSQPRIMDTHNWQILEGLSVDKSSGSGQYLLKFIFINHFGREGPKGNGECLAEVEGGPKAAGSSELLDV